MQTAHAPTFAPALKPSLVGMDTFIPADPGERTSNFRGFSITTRTVELEQSLKAPEKHRYGASFSVRKNDNGGLRLWRRVPVSVFSTSESASAAALRIAHDFVDSRLQAR
jgi:hypothetical protein